MMAGSFTIGDQRLRPPAGPAGRKRCAAAQYWEVNSGHGQATVCRMPMMKKTQLRAAGIVALKSKAHLVRQVALEQGISYDETPVLGDDNVIRFSFQPMDDASTHKLAFAIPREAYARRAIFGDGPPPGVRKKT
jgi:hypothetical protein